MIMLSKLHRLHWGWRLRICLATALALVLVSLLVRLVCHRPPGSPNLEIIDRTQPTWITAEEPIAAMFVDLGAHFGDAVRNFLGRCKTESECQLQEPVQIPWFIAREDFVIYMFEADHRFTPDLQNLTAELAESEPPIKVWLRDATAVHNQDGDIDLFVDEWSHDNAYWASSIRPWDGWAIRSDPAVPVRKVQAIDFARWLELTARPDDYVVVNLDLEGAEFVILPHLWESRAFRLIDSLLVHWHDNHNGFSPAEKDAAKMAVVNMIKAGVHIPYF